LNEKGKGIQKIEARNQVRGYMGKGLYNSTKKEERMNRMQGKTKDQEKWKSRSEVTEDLR